MILTSEQEVQAWAMAQYDVHAAFAYCRIMSEKNQLPDNWQQKDFGDVPHKKEGQQLTIFFEDSHEPPEPEDFRAIAEYERAWRSWEKRHLS